MNKISGIMRAEVTAMTLVTAVIQVTAVTLVTAVTVVVVNVASAPLYLQIMC